MRRGGPFRPPSGQGWTMGLPKAEVGEKPNLAEGVCQAAEGRGAGGYSMETENCASRKVHGQRGFYNFKSLKPFKMFSLRGTLIISFISFSTV